MNDTDTTPTCACGRPLRDTMTFCDECGATFARVLGDVPWLEDELETTITRAKGVDYRTKGGTQGTERPSPVVWSAADARRNLQGFLIAWVKFCEDTNVRNSSPLVGPPPGDLPSLTALSRYLLWRVDGLAFSERGPACLEQIGRAVGHAGHEHAGPTGLYRFIDSAAEKMYAGKCGYEMADATCTNELYVKIGAKVVRCNVCGTEWDVPERRAWLLAEAEEQLATAVEISRSVSWLGEQPLTADRVRKWKERGRIIVRGHNHRNEPLYRVGDAIDLLAAGTTKKKDAA